MKTVGDRLKEQRIKMKISPEAAAEKIGVETSLYLSWENGECEPDTEHLLAAAHLFRVTGNELLYGADGMGSRTMFPKDATPAVTPMSDWRFLAGVLLAFAGGAGVLMFIMRYMSSGEAETMAELLDVGGPWLIALAALFATGIIICIAACILKAFEVKNKKKRNKKQK